MSHKRYTASKPKYVIVTAAEDAHLDFVLPHMPKADTVIVDPVPAILDQTGGLSFELADGRPTCLYRGIRLSNVASVWDRRPTRFEMNMIDDVAEPFRNYARDTIRWQAAQLYAQFPDALWVSDWYAVQKAELKSGQLAMAHRLGFNIPNTLFTSDAREAAAFRERYPATVIKSLANKSPMVGDELLLFMAARLERESQLSLTNLHRGPAIFQQAVDNIRHELRITVIGDRVFAATVDLDAETEGLSIVRDWRLSHYQGEVSIENFDDQLPSAIKKQCVALVREMGLQFGAIDMILDNQGKFWFLEINPSGQWGFVEYHTGQPLGKTMAGLLLSGRK
jgi:glutathione synthase/RimK-type ligase-like ATP-grasp enzyme